MSTRGRQAQLEAKIKQVKQELLALGDLRPGTLSEQYNVCGKAGCACKADPPRKHGPYSQVSFTWQGRSRTQFVRGENVGTMRQQVRNYERLRELVGGVDRRRARALVPAIRGGDLKQGEPPQDRSHGHPGHFPNESGRGARRREAIAVS